MRRGFDGACSEVEDDDWKAAGYRYKSPVEVGVGLRVGGAGKKGGFKGQAGRYEMEQWEEVLGQKVMTWKRRWWCRRIVELSLIHI